MTPKYIFVHHTAVSYDKNPDQWRATDNYHKGKGWGKGGYNAEAAKNGSIHEFRADGETTVAQFFAEAAPKFPAAEQKKVDFLNKNALSICLDGNFDIEEPTQEQCDAVYNWLVDKMKKHGIPRERVFCHRDVSPKSCPGSKLPDDIFGYFESRTQEKPNEGTDWLTKHSLISVPHEPDEPVRFDPFGIMMARYTRKLKEWVKGWFDEWMDEREKNQ